MADKNQTENLHVGGLSLWAGTQESADKYLALRGKIDRRMELASHEVLALADSWDVEQDEALECEHRMLEVIGDVGVVTVKGALVDGYSSWWSYREECGYGDVRNALVAAINAKVKAVVLYLKTPGGQVRGLGPCVDFIAGVASKLIPIQAYSDTVCESGGVWVAAATGKFTASPHALLGSIGVYSVLREFSEQEKMMGVRTKVVKSTPLKGYGNPFEKLSKEAEDEAQRIVLETASMFNQGISRGLGLPLDYVSKTLATGQEWFGAKALDLRLISKLQTFDELLVDLQAKVTQNNGETLNFPQR